MVTKEELKKEVDKLPESLLEDVYRILKRLMTKESTSAAEQSWTKWKKSLDNFSPDFLEDWKQSTHQTRESFDS